MAREEAEMRYAIQPMEDEAQLKEDEEPPTVDEVQLTVAAMSLTLDAGVAPRRLLATAAHTY
jgi:hypothetical protein